MANFQDMINGGIPVLVDFYATWCGPCRTMHPVLDDLKRELGDGVRIIKLDIENRANIRIVQQYNIRSVPTLMIFSGGEVRWSAAGARSAAELRRLLEQYGK